MPSRATIRWLFVLALVVIGCGVVGLPDHR